MEYDDSAFKAWISDCCEFGDFISRGDELHASYNAWATEKNRLARLSNSVPSNVFVGMVWGMKRKGHGMALVRSGAIRQRSAKRVMYRGIRLKPAAPPAAPGPMVAVGELI